VSKSKNDGPHVAQTLVDADEELRDAAEKFTANQGANQTTNGLREAALAFAAAWHACGGSR